MVSAQEAQITELTSRVAELDAIIEVKNAQILEMTSQVVALNVSLENERKARRKQAQADAAREKAAEDRHNACMSIIRNISAAIPGETVPGVDITLDIPKHRPVAGYLEMFTGTITYAELEKALEDGVNVIVCFATGNKGGFAIGGFNAA